MTPSVRSNLAGVILLAGLVTAGAAFAHDGHDHGAPSAPLGTTVAPRAEASSGDFEVVAIALGTELEITLDTFRGNEPVDRAELEIDTPSGLIKAKAEFERAIAVARAQGSLSFELHATLALARLLDEEDERTHAQDVLAPVYARFTEGFSTEALRDARSLLGTAH